MAKQMTKQELFEDFFVTANKAFTHLEDVFDLKGVWAQVFGVSDEPVSFFNNPELEEAAKERLRASNAWQRLDAVYEYAVNGVDDGDPMSVVISGQEVLQLISTELGRPCQQWDEIVARGDGRFTLDDGQYIELSKVALLANVDVRTVRNAISSGELQSRKSDSVVFIENTSARTWLLSRRGFKPTVVTDTTFDLDTVRTAAEFGAALAVRRHEIAINDDSCTETAKALKRDIQLIHELECGLFTLPIDATFNIADLYRVDRQQLLRCVMRVFFPEQWAMLNGD